MQPGTRKGLSLLFALVAIIDLVLMATRAISFTEFWIIIAVCALASYALKDRRGSEERAVIGKEGEKEKKGRAQ